MTSLIVTVYSCSLLAALPTGDHQQRTSYVENIATGAMAGCAAANLLSLGISSNQGEWPLPHFCMIQLSTPAETAAARVCTSVSCCVLSLICTEARKPGSVSGRVQRLFQSQRPATHQGMNP